MILVYLKAQRMAIPYPDADTVKSSEDMIILTGASGPVATIPRENIERIEFVKEKEKEHVS